MFAFYLGPGSLPIWRESQLGILLFCLSLPLGRGGGLGLGRGWLAFLPGCLLPLPATSQSWLALTTGSSLASTQTELGRCLSIWPSVSQHKPPCPPHRPPPLGSGNRSGQSGPSSVPKPDGKAVYRIMRPPPARPQTCTTHAGRDPSWVLLAEAWPPGQGQGLGDRTRRRQVLVTGRCYMTSGHPSPLPRASVSPRWNE